MSNTEESEPKALPQDARGLDASGEALSQIAALVEEVKTKKAAFDAEVDSTLTLLSQQTSRAEAAGEQALTLRDDIASARNVADAERSALQDLVTKAKGISVEIDGFRTEIATAKGSIDTVLATANTDLATIGQSKTIAVELVAAATSLSDKLTTDHTQITGQVASLQSQQAALKSLIAEMTEAKASALKDAELAAAHATETQNARTKFGQLVAEAQSQRDTLVQKQSALQSKISEIEAINTEIKQLRLILLEGAQGGPKSIQDQINDLHTQITTMLKEITENRKKAASELTDLQKTTETSTKALVASNEKKFEDLYKTLEQKILSLLPSAGAAGLSTTYYDAKSRYAPTSYAGKFGAPILHGWKGWIRCAFGYNPASVMATLFFYLLFLAPLGFIIYQSVALLLRMENQHFIPDPKMLAVRFLIVIPLATLSGFGLLSLRSYRRLYEVYNHKQRVMELYQSFSREVAEKGDEEQKKKLLEIMLNAVASKPWEDAEANIDEKRGAVALIERLIDDAAKLKAIGA